MTPDKTPSDAELLALNAGEVHFSESPTKYPEAGHGTQYHAGAPGVLEFARAVLAKWGTPPAVARTETIELRRMLCAAHAGHLAYMDDGEAQDNREFPLIDFLRDSPPEIQDKLHRRALKKFSTPQPTQAQAAPLTAKQMESGREAIFSTGNPFCPCDSKTFRKVSEWVERYHGIKGGQHEI